MEDEGTVGRGRENIKKRERECADFGSDDVGVAVVVIFYEETSLPANS